MKTPNFWVKRRTSENGKWENCWTEIETILMKQSDNAPKDCENPVEMHYSIFISMTSFYTALCLMRDHLYSRIIVWEYICQGNPLNILFSLLEAARFFKQKICRAGAFKIKTFGPIRLATVESVLSPKTSPLSVVHWGYAGAEWQYCQW